MVTRTRLRSREITDLVGHPVIVMRQGEPEDRSDRGSTRNQTEEEGYRVRREECEHLRPHDDDRRESCRRHPRQHAASSREGGGLPSVIQGDAVRFRVRRAPLGIESRGGLSGCSGRSGSSRTRDPTRGLHPAGRASAPFLRRSCRARADSCRMRRFPFGTSSPGTPHRASSFRK